MSLGDWGSMAATLAGRSLYKGMLGRYRVICARTEIHHEIPISSRRSEDKELLSSSQRFGSLRSVSFPSSDDAFSPFFFVNRKLSFPVRADASGLQASYPRFSTIQEGESALNMSLPPPGDLPLPKFVEASEWAKKLFGIWQKLICEPESVSGSEKANVEVFPYLVPGMTLTHEEFFEFYSSKTVFQYERTAQGRLLMWSPIGALFSLKMVTLNMQLGNWSKQDDTGVVFGSHAGFTLPNGAVRAADATWVQKSRWKAIPLEEREKFAPICPDFVMELRTKTDSLKVLKIKMEEYIENGTALGWLIDPFRKQVYVYQPNTVMQELNSPTTLSGNPILPDFVLDLSEIW